MGTTLQLHIGAENDTTVIKNSYFTSPLKLGYPHSYHDRKHIVLMMASAGILKGDTFLYEIQADAGTRTLLTEQSYTKIFDTGDGSAHKELKLTLAGNASFFYMPCAVIPFTGSTFDGELSVELEPESEFACCDIAAVGRVGMGEKFGFCRYHNRICVRENGRPVWIDHCLWEPQRGGLDNLFYLDGHTHQGTFYYHGIPQKEERLLTLMQTLTEQSQDCLYAGASRAYRGISMRVLADTAQDIEQLFMKLQEVVLPG